MMRRPVPDSLFDHEMAMLARLLEVIEAALYQVSERLTHWSRPNVMPTEVGIHAFLVAASEGVDPGDKHRHDVGAPAMGRSY